MPHQQAQDTYDNSTVPHRSCLQCSGSECAIERNITRTYTRAPVIRASCLRYTILDALFLNMSSHESSSQQRQQQLQQSLLNNSNKDDDADFSILPASSLSPSSFMEQLELHQDSPHQHEQDDDDDDDRDLSPLPFHRNVGDGVDEDVDEDDHEEEIDNHNSNNNSYLYGEKMNSIESFMLRERSQKNAASSKFRNEYDNHKNDDDEYGDVSSHMDRNVKIEEMRQRVEAQLVALTRGTDFMCLRQQVAELRRGNGNGNQNQPDSDIATLPHTVPIQSQKTIHLTVPSPDDAHANLSPIPISEMDDTAIPPAATFLFDANQNDNNDEHGDGYGDNDNDMEEVEVVDVKDSFGKSLLPVNRNSSKLLEKPSLGIASTATATTTATETTSTSTRGGSSSSNKTLKSLKTTRYVEREAVVDPYGDSGIYTGELHLRKPHGLGEMTYLDGRVYSGGWNYGKWHGKGACVVYVDMRFFHVSTEILYLWLWSKRCCAQSERMACSSTRRMTTCRGLES